MENRKYVIFLVPVILGLFIFNFKLTLAYDSGTHEFISDTAIKLFNNNYSSKINSDLEKYLLDGVRREDDPPRWMNHFYDPIYNRGLSQDGKIEPLYQLGDWQASKLWAQDGGNQNRIQYSPVIATILSSIQSGKIEKFFPTADFTWNEAMKYWIQGDKEMAMFTLGHIAHLIQDVSVPDHTRNDPHPGDSPYENYSTQYTLSHPDTLLTQSIKNSKPIELADLNSYFDRMATYSNNNFYSKDTIGIQSGYSMPQPDYPIVEGDYNYEYKTDQFGNTYKILIVKKQSILNSVSSSKENYVLSVNKSGGDQVLKDYWSLLSKKATQYSAGAINLFFNEVEKNKDNPAFAKKESPSFLAQAADAVKNSWNSAKNFVLGVFGSGNDFQEISQIPSDGQNQIQNSSSPIDSATNENTINNKISPPTTTGSSKNQSTKTYKVSRVIDGDTIVLDNGTVIRYIGIDAPEIAYRQGKSDCFAEEALQRNKELTLNKNVRLEYIPGTRTDKYDRTLAYVWDGNNLANEILVAEGYAYAYNFGQKHSKDQEFLDAQTTARASKLGLWGPACKKDTTANNLTSTTTASSSEEQNSDNTENQNTTDKSNADNNTSNNLSSEIKNFCQFSSGQNQTPSLKNLIINEVAWMGTLNSSNDEWIELKNISNSELNLSGYQLIGKDNKIEIDLGKIKFAPNSNTEKFLLLERTDDNSVANIKADLIYSGSLANENSGLRLFDANCRLIDEIIASPNWPSGDVSSKRTAERNSNFFGWHTSATIGGTPKNENSFGYSSGGGGTTNSTSNSQTAQDNPTPKETPQFYPIVINEIMYNPKGADNNREWIEIYNSGETSVDIAKWKIFEGETGHLLSLRGGPTTIGAGEYAVIADDAEQFKLDYPAIYGQIYDESFALFDSSFSLNNSGKIIAIKNGDLKIDEVNYLPEWGGNDNGKSIQKFSDGWKESAPTPGKENIFSQTQKYSGTPTHLVISEIQTDGQNPDDEFIELYNPTQNPISLKGYSLQYLSGQATSTHNIHFLAKINEDIVVPPLKFFLLANKDGIYSQKNPDLIYSYSLSKSSAIVFLSNSIEPIPSENDLSIIDYIAYGDVNLPNVFSVTAPDSNQSAERLALSGNFCVSPKNEGEFLGNGCKTGMPEGDFEIRQNPRPQGLLNLAEPRNAPLAVENFSLSYSTTSLILSASWQTTSSSEIISTSTSSSTISENNKLTYKIVDDKENEIGQTASSSISKNVDEIGRDYFWSILAMDAEGLSSPTTTASIYFPSFLDSLDFFKQKDSNGNEGYYLEGRYSQYPFVPNLYAPRGNLNGSILVFFLNHEAAKEPMIEGGYKTQSQEIAASLLTVDYNHCAAYPGPLNMFMSADVLDPCPLYCLMSGTPSKEYFEDKSFLLKALPQKELSENDYVTVAFYAYDHSSVWSGWEEILKLAAIDKTKHYLKYPAPKHYPPEKIQNFAVKLHDEEIYNPHVFLTWDDTTDKDSVDKLITYEYAVSTSTDSTSTETENNSSLLWNKTYKQYAISNGNLFQTGPEISLGDAGKYKFYLRAKDNFGLPSEVSSFILDFNPPQFIAGTTEKYPWDRTYDIATTENSNQIYKIGEKINIKNPSKITELLLEAHNIKQFWNQTIPPSSFDARISISLIDGTSSDPNNGLTEIYSKVITQIPALYYFEQKIFDIKMDQSLLLTPGNYFFEVKTLNGDVSNRDQGLSISMANNTPTETNVYVFRKPGSSGVDWAEHSTKDIFFRLFGYPQTITEMANLLSQPKNQSIKIKGIFDQTTSTLATTTEATSTENDNASSSLKELDIVVKNENQDLLPVNSTSTINNLANDEKLNTNESNLIVVSPESENSLDENLEIIETELLNLATTTQTTTEIIENDFAKTAEEATTTQTTTTEEIKINEVELLTTTTTSETQNETNTATTSEIVSSPSKNQETITITTTTEI